METKIEGEKIIVDGLLLRTLVSATNPNIEVEYEG